MAEPLKVTVRPTPTETNVPLTGGWEAVDTQPIAPAQVGPSAEGGWAPVITAPMEQVPVAQTDWQATGTQPAPVSSAMGAPAASAPPADDIWDTLTDPRTGTFPFNYLNTYREMNQESRKQMSRGVEEMESRAEKETVGDRAAAVGHGLLDVLGGAAGFATDPITAATRSIAGQPVENATGLPKAYTEFIINLGIPGIGMTKLPQAQKIIKPIQESLSPETISRSFPSVPGGEDAAGLIRKGTGEAARATEQTAHQLESYYPTVAKMTPAEQLGIQNYIDGGPARTAPGTPELRAFADAMKGALEERKKALQALPDFQQHLFREEYFPHFWQNPNGSPASYVDYAGMGKQGSGLSTKGRTIPTVEEGIAAGLKPVYTNPIDATMRYVMSMDKFIASTKIMKQAERDGTVVWVNPQRMGASGNPMGGQSNVPAGYVPLKGRGTQDGPFQAYAPEAFARVYNNWLSQGFEGLGPNFEKGYNSVRLFTNAMTQSLLGLGAYHAFTMVEAGISTTIAQGIAAMRGGDKLGLLKAFPKAGMSPVSLARKGKDYKNIYLGLNKMVPAEDKEVVDLITQAGGRMGKMTHHATDLQTSKLGDYFTAWRRAELKSSFMKQFGVGGIPNTAKGIMSTLGRTLETINKPLFQHYIPAMKTGAAGTLMADWLKANPTATQAQKLSQARKIVDTVDDRFGEMIQDNIFWHKLGKQIAQIAMLSYSWNLGGMRAIGGGLRDIGKFAAGQGAWTPKADYVVSTAITWAALNSIGQTLMTGETPFQTDTPVLDMVAMRSGGVDAASGQPERLLVPGIMKDVFAYATHPLQEVGNKLNPAIKGAWGLLQNKDWRDDPIMSPRDPGQSFVNKSADWLGNLVSHVYNVAGPISVKNLTKGPKEGSEIGPIGTFLGVRPASRMFVDPEGYESQQDYFARKAWYGDKRGRGGKLGHDAREKAKYGGPQ